MSSPTDEQLDESPLVLSKSVVFHQSGLATGRAVHPSRVRYYALAWLTVTSALAYLCRSPLGVAESTIRDELGLTLKQSGWLQGAFFWTYAILQVPSGWFAKRYGTRISLSLFAIGWSIATFGIGIASAFWLLIGASLLMGAAQAGVVPASYNSIGHWMPISQRTLGCGVLTAGMQIGAIVASGLIAVLMVQIGWRWAIISFALPGLLWAIGFFCWFRDQPSQVCTVNSIELALIRSGRETAESKTEINAIGTTGLLSLVRSPIMWCLCGQQVCRAAGGGFFAIWLPTYLQMTHGLSPEVSGYLQCLILAAILPANIFGGMLTDRIWRQTSDLRLSRSGVGAFFLAACALAIFGARFVTSSTLAVGLLALGGFFATLAGPCAFAVAIDLGGSRVPQVVAIMNMSGNFSAAICPVVIGWLLESANWNSILFLFAGVYLAGAICWVLLNPNVREHA
jgi:MFS transporter, ACS family, D-galactonate transporter